MVKKRIEDITAFAGGNQTIVVKPFAKLADDPRTFRAGASGQALNMLSKMTQKMAGNSENHKSE